METTEQFRKQKYLNLETYRKNGEGVRTPVWFVENEKSLFIITMANSWKVKRIQKDNRVSVAPCRVNGYVTGHWQRARAKEIHDPELEHIINRLYQKKYGLMNTIFALRRAKNGNQNTILEVLFEV